MRTMRSGDGIGENHWPASLGPDDIKGGRTRHRGTWTVPGHRVAASSREHRASHPARRAARRRPSATAPIAGLEAWRWSPAEGGSSQRGTGRQGQHPPPGRPLSSRPPAGYSVRETWNWVEELPFSDLLADPRPPGRR